MKNNFLKSFLFLCAFCLSTAAFSQIAIGPKLGVAIANISSDGDFDFKSETNLQIGLVLELGSGPLSIQPEITYLGRGYGLNVLGNDITTKVAYIDIGALVKLRFGADEGFGGYLGAGPFFGYAISGTTDDGTGNVDIDFDRDGYKRTDLALAGAVGLTYRAGLIFFFDARYIFGVTDIFDDSSNTFDIKANNRTLGLTIGVLAPF